MLILKVKTEVKWIQEAATTPLFGGFFLFILMFIPAVAMSFLAQAAIPVLHNEVGFTKAMLVLLPAWNIVLWLLGIRLFLFFIPSWILFTIIAIIKGILMITGVDDGQ